MIGSFLFLYDTKDEKFAKAAIETAEGMYDKAMTDHGLVHDAERFTLIICPDTGPYIRETDKTEESYEPWMVGNANYEQRKLCILSVAASDRSFEDMLGIVRHEVVHIVFDRLAVKSPDDVSPLIAEGGAVYLAEQVYPELLDKSDRPDAIKLNDEDYFYENEGYNYSGVYIGYIIRKYGKEAYKNIYSEKDPIEKYLYPGFEEDAIDSFCN